MKIIGLFIVVFGGIAFSRIMGFSDAAQIVGAIMGAGSYLIITLSN